MVQTSNQKKGIDPVNSYEFPSNSLAELTLIQALLANLSQDNSGECRRDGDRNRSSLGQARVKCFDFLFS